MMVPGNLWYPSVKSVLSPMTSVGDDELLLEKEDDSLSCISDVLLGVLLHGGSKVPSTIITEKRNLRTSIDESEVLVLLIHIALHKKRVYQICQKSSDQRYWTLLLCHARALYIPYPSTYLKISMN